MLLITAWATWRFLPASDLPANEQAHAPAAPAPTFNPPPVEPVTATFDSPAIAPAIAPARVVRRQARRPAAPIARPVVDEEGEIATAFLPLMPGGLHPMDGGQVVRVELPRAALTRFGLPMNIERAGERVKADVLIGHDGMARAIRFVR